MYFILEYKIINLKVTILKVLLFLFLWNSASEMIKIVERHVFCSSIISSLSFFLLNTTDRYILHLLTLQALNTKNVRPVEQNTTAKSWFDHAHFKLSLSCWHLRFTVSLSHRVLRNSHLNLNFFLLVPSPWKVHIYNFLLWYVENILRRFLLFGSFISNRLIHTLWLRHHFASRTTWYFDRSYVTLTVKISFWQ